MSRRTFHKPQAAAAAAVSRTEEELDAPKLSITMLGAGQEVGRSCCVIQYRGRTVVCDAGLHPAHPGMGSLPFLDELDWSTVDAILITQYVVCCFHYADDSFHVDHAAALPYVMEKVCLRVTPLTRRPTSRKAMARST